MKRLYSIILLGSLMIGILQPIMPMFGYVVGGGELSQILYMDEDAFSACALASERGVNCEMDCINDQKDLDQNVLLLDGEYYPIPVSIQPVASAAILPAMIHLFTPANEKLLSHLPHPHSPPPRRA